MFIEIIYSIEEIYFDIESVLFDATFIARNLPYKVNHMLLTNFHLPLSDETLFPEGFVPWKS